MPAELQRIPFTPELLPKMQAFECGTEPWEREVSDWIKALPGEGGAVDELLQGKQVWLYITDAGELVGFGSLGVAKQRWPGQKDPKIEASIIPMLGVDRKVWGQPPGPPEERYSSRILGDLIVEARKEQSSRPMLILFVAVENTRGVAFYLRAGFLELHKPYTDPKTGRVHKRLVLDIRNPLP